MSPESEWLSGFEFNFCPYDFLFQIQKVFSAVELR